MKLSPEAAQWMRRYHEELRSHGQTMSRSEDLEQALHSLLLEYIEDSRRLVPDPEAASSVKAARAILATKQDK